MCYTGLIKRIIPFALTFTVGLFVASFFVSIAFPNPSWRNGRRIHRFHEIQRLRVENDELREKLRQARIDNEALRSINNTDFVIPEVAPPVSHEMHHPPPPPRKPKQPRTEIVQ